MSRKYTRVRGHIRMQRRKESEPKNPADEFAKRGEAMINGILGIKSKRRRK